MLYSYMLTKIILITVEDGGGLKARVKLVMDLLESCLYEFHYHSPLSLQGD